MKKTLALTLALLLGAAHAPAQVVTPGSQPPPPARQQRPTPTPTPAGDPDEDNVVRITTNLVQFDAVVKDSRGRLVTDLRQEEFEVFVDGKRQEVTNSSFVSAGSGVDAGARPSPAPAAGGAAPAPSAPIKPAQVRRTIALVADDLNIAWENMLSVRRTLKKFVDEQMQPGDLVAIVRTSAGMGALQQFTSDKRLLYRAIESVQWDPRGRGMIGSFTPLEDDPLNRPVRKTGGAQGEDDGDRRIREDEKALAEDARRREASAAELRETRERAFTVGALGALGFLMRAMGGCPAASRSSCSPRGSRFTTGTTRVKTSAFGRSCAAS